MRWVTIVLGAAAGLALTLCRYPDEPPRLPPPTAPTNPTSGTVGKSVPERATKGRPAFSPGDVLDVRRPDRREGADANTHVSSVFDGAPAHDAAPPELDNTSLTPGGTGRTVSRRHP
jgi:hypothetical protein